jgi:superfamily I DNA and/or RNA helicase
MPEGKSPAEDMSHWNEFEIDMVYGLVNHLVQQGTYTGRDIAVLTPYLGQLRKLQERFSQSFAVTLSESGKGDLKKALFMSIVTETH